MVSKHRDRSGSIGSDVAICEPSPLIRTSVTSRHCVLVHEIAPINIGHYLLKLLIWFQINFNHKQARTITAVMILVHIARETVTLINCSYQVWMVEMRLLNGTALYWVAQNKIPHQTICNISAISGLILKILEAAYSWHFSESNGIQRIHFTLIIQPHYRVKQLQ